MSGRTLRIAHVITGLGLGGAEGMLERLLSALDGGEFGAAVWSLGALGPVGERLARRGVPVHALGFGRRLPDPRRFHRLVRELRAWRPDVVQTWMYHADLLGGIAASMAGRIPVVWNLRQSTLVRGRTRGTTLAIAKLCALLSARLPSRIVSCSEAAAAAHRAFGYDASRLVCIPNGFDLSRFRPDPQARASLHRELGLEDATPLVGMIARFDPQKDHRTFLAAAGLLAAARPAARFLLCGEGMHAGNAQLQGWIEAAGVHGRCLLLGPRADLPRITAALDVATSSARYGEGFPNVIGEAMACGVPVVATEVGDSGLILGDCGRLVAPGDPAALAAGWEALLALPPEARAAGGLRGRERIAARFSLAAIAARYAALYREVAAACPRP